MQSSFARLSLSSVSPPQTLCHTCLSFRLRFTSWKWTALYNTSTHTPTKHVQLLLFWCNVVSTVCVCVTVTHSYPTPKNKNDYSMGNLALLLFGVKSQQYYREEKKKQLTTGVIVRRGRIRRSRRRGEKHQIIAIVSLCNWFSLLHARHTRRTFALLHLCYYGERSLTSRKKSEINKSNLLINKWRREREKKSWEYFASRRTTHTHTTKRKPRGYSKPFI